MLEYLNCTYSWNAPLRIFLTRHELYKDDILFRAFFIRQLACDSYSINNVGILPPYASRLA
jgi:hypothetical protein